MDKFKGRLIKLSIEIVGEEPFSPVLGVRRKATVFGDGEIQGQVRVDALCFRLNEKKIFRPCATKRYHRRCAVVSEADSTVLHVHH